MIPRHPALDFTLHLKREGYEFITRQAARLGTDAFEARVMLTRAVCAFGADAGKMFYHPGRFSRVGAMPPTTLRLLQGRESVNMLDAEPHQRRKAMFLSILDATSVERLRMAFEREWMGQFAQPQPRVVLYDTANAVLCRAVCSWAGVPLEPSDVSRHAEDFAAMVDEAAGVGFGWLRGYLRRRRVEHWLRPIIASPPPGSVPQQLAQHLDADTARVELINLLRPVVAVSRFITFAAHALHTHPSWRSRLLQHDGDVPAFVQEVRRFYPFFPAVGGRVREPFTWRDRSFKHGDWVLFDLYGTNHDPRIWGDPHQFRPERFHADPHEVVAQGTGDYARDHRCPGEPVTRAIVETAVRRMVRMAWQVPEQDLSIDLHVMPALPASRMQWRDAANE